MAGRLVDFLLEASQEDCLPCYSVHVRGNIRRLGGDSFYWVHDVQMSNQRLRMRYPVQLCFPTTPKVTEQDLSGNRANFEDIANIVPGYLLMGKRSGLLAMASLDT